jgi:hypothetical protein
VLAKAAFNRVILQLGQSGPSFQFLLQYPLITVTIHIKRRNYIFGFFFSLSYEYLFMLVTLTTQVGFLVDLGGKNMRRAPVLICAKAVHKYI